MQLASFISGRRAAAIAWALAAIAGPAAAQAPCGEDFAVALDSCTPAVCVFNHPMTGQPTEQRVVGSEGGACRYVQEMPNGGQMSCSYSEESRRAMAAFLRRVAAAQSIGASASTDLSTGETTTASRVDGEPAANPLARSLASGECRVTGYGG